MCDSKKTPRSGDVCLRPSQLPVDGPYRTYSAEPHEWFDIGWWLGVTPVAEGWMPYDGGSCNVFSCRQTDPTGKVIHGWPDGDANQDSFTDSLDALWVLQAVAGAVERGERAFNPFADVDQEGGLTTRDALLILQDDAGLILGLPLRRGPAPFPDK